MIYAEAAYFDGVHVAHIAAWQDHKRLERIRRRAIAHRDAQRRNAR